LNEIGKTHKKKNERIQSPITSKTNVEGQTN